MLRQVMIPNEKNSTISIPSEYYGMEVEILIFPFNDIKPNQNNDALNNSFDKNLFSFDKYKFDRNEANSYE